MSLGPLFVDIEGTELGVEDKEILRHPLVGGVIYFSRNFASVEQITQLSQEIKALREPELLIAVDHEGGRVQRFREGFTELPAVRTIGSCYDENEAAGTNYARSHGWLMAAELKAVGVDFSFAPVLDLYYGRSEVIQDRAFHASAEVVAHLAYQYIKGMQAAGMTATGKHFPGHGWAREDSHTAIPVDGRDYKTIYKHDLLPYQRLLKNSLGGVMPAHVIYPEVDDLPAGFSSRWLQSILRKQMHFEGLIFSDDLSMKGATVVGQSFLERAHKALLAGCDMVLICNNRPGVIEVLDGLMPQANPLLQLRATHMRGHVGMSYAELNNSENWQAAVKLINQQQTNQTRELNL